MDFLTYKPLEALMFFVRDSSDTFDLDLKINEKEMSLTLTINNNGARYQCTNYDDNFLDLQIAFYERIQRNLINTLTQSIN